MLLSILWQERSSVGAGKSCLHLEKRWSPQKKRRDAASTLGSSRMHLDKLTALQTKPF